MKDRSFKAGFITAFSSMNIFQKSHNRLCIFSDVFFSGIGLALAERLITIYPKIHLCLACRSKYKGQAAQKTLQALSPVASVSLLLVDLSSLTSIYSAAEELRSRFHHFDLVFLNAGIMPDTKVDWSYFCSNLFSSKCINMFATGVGLLEQRDETTLEGLRQIFVTNVFGHFVLVKEIQNLLGGSDANSQIIWTSSSNATKESFSLSDIQHRLGREAYSSSKYASDLVSYALNERLKDQGIYSHVICPGLVMTNLTYGILPWWIWILLLPLLCLLRAIIPSMTLTPKVGCEALVWLTRQNPETLDPMTKFHSRWSVCGHHSVTKTKMDLDPDTARETYDRLLRLERECSVMFRKS